MKMIPPLEKSEVVINMPLLACWPCRAPANFWISARHIVVLDHGQKIAEGAPKEIVENREVVRAYLGTYVHPPTPGDA